MFSDFIIKDPYSFNYKFRLIISSKSFLYILDDIASRNITTLKKISLKFVLEKSIYLRESRSELKHKFILILFKSLLIIYQKLKIEKIKTEIDKKKLNKLFLNIEYKEKKLSNNNYYKA